MIGVNVPVQKIRGIEISAPTHSFTYDGVRLNIYHVNKGEGLPKHEQKFAHAFTCHSGVCILRKENKEVLVTKDTQPINLVENEWHEIEAVEDNTVFVNIFAESKQP
jgi:quercetin dioxygenase-like cupin family protein